MKFILATKNEGKLKEIKRILEDTDIEICLESDIGIDMDVDETGSTFEENSLLKAKAVMEASGLPAIADDSGLCVNALNGEPGVYSARYGGSRLCSKDQCELLLSKIPEGASREAYFESVITCCFPDGRIIVAKGVCNGTIAKELRGSRGFAYDPVFIPDGYDITFSEMTADAKNNISHRGIALRNFKDKLLKLS